MVAETCWAIQNIWASFGLIQGFSIHRHLAWTVDHYLTYLTPRQNHLSYWLISNFISVYHRSTSKTLADDSTIFSIDRVGSQTWTERELWFHLCVTIPPEKVLLGRDPTLLILWRSHGLLFPPHSLRICWVWVGAAIARTFLWLFVSFFFWAQVPISHQATSRYRGFFSDDSCGQWRNHREEVEGFYKL